MQQIGRDERWTERIGAFVITEFCGKNGRYVITLCITYGDFDVAELFFNSYATPGLALDQARSICLELNAELSRKTRASRN